MPKFEEYPLLDSPADDDVLVLKEVGTGQTKKVLYSSLRGPAGSTGPAGSGIRGATGPAGPQGGVGATGTQGITGPSGPVSATGPRGVTGPGGSQGVTGVTGATGPRGVTGPSASSAAEAGGDLQGNYPDPRLASGVAGAGLIGGGGTGPLAINTGSGIEVVTNTLRIAPPDTTSGLTGGGALPLAVNPGAGVDISSGTVRIATTAAGIGLTGGGASALSINPTNVNLNGWVDCSSILQITQYDSLYGQHKVYTPGTGMTVNWARWARFGRMIFMTLKATFSASGPPSCYAAIIGFTVTPSSSSLFPGTGVTGAQNTVIGNLLYFDKSQAAGKQHSNFLMIVYGGYTFAARQGYGSTSGPDGVNFYSGKDTLWGGANVFIDSGDWVSASFVFEG